MQVTADACDLSYQAFAELLQRMQLGGTFVEHRFPGCLRLQLLESVRAMAVARCARGSAAASLSFGRWVARGARWSMAESGQLTLAWERLSRRERALIWHTVGEQDDPDLVSRITGVPRARLERERAAALGTLRRLRVNQYLDRIDRKDCQKAIEQLTAQPLPPAPVSGALRHAGICAECHRVYEDVLHLDSRLASQLPGQLLGWWPESGYQRMKNSVAAPLGDPPFLARALRRAAAPETETGTGATGTGTGRDGGLTRRPPRPPRPPWSLKSRAALTVTGFAVGMVVGYTGPRVAGEPAEVREPGAPGTSPWSVSLPE